MASEIDNKPSPQTVLRLFLYFAVFTCGMVLSQTLSSLFLSLATVLISVVAFSLLYYRIGCISLLTVLIPLAFIGLSSGISALLSAALIPILATALAISIKKGLRPSDTIVVSTVVYILAAAAVLTLQMLLANGAFSPKELFNALSDTIDSTTEALLSELSSLASVTNVNGNMIASTVKAMFIGGYIAMQLLVVLLAYYSVLWAARLTRDARFPQSTELFDVKPRAVSAWIYTLCLLFSPISYSSTTSIHFYTYLTTNLATVLTPLFFFTGIFYIANIKFKKEHGNPLFFVLSIAAALFGIYQLLVIYLAFCGVVYTIRYGRRKDSTKQ